MMVELVTGIVIIQFLLKVIYLSWKIKSGVGVIKRKRKLKTLFSFQLHFGLILYISHQCIAVF